VTNDDVIQLKGGTTLLSNYQGSVIKALLHLFPNVGLEEKQFTIVPHKHWLDPKNRRRFFESYAKEKEFDFLVADNWYSTTTEEVLNAKEPGASSVVKYYGGSISKGLFDCFPEIPFEKSKFVTRSSHYWKDAQHRRDFFLDVAKKKGFNPLVAENWYPLSFSELASFKGSNAVLAHHNSSFVNALLQLFPDIGLSVNKFVTLSRKYWMDKTNRREVFRQHARRNCFDPLVADNWYTVSIEDFRSNNENAKLVLSFYGAEFSEALAHLYPTIGLDKSKFNGQKDLAPLYPNLHHLNGVT